MFVPSRLKVFATLIIALALFLGVSASTVLADSPLPLPITHQHFNFYQGVLDNPSAEGLPGESTYKNPSSPICATTTSADANVNTDCEGNAPHNETSIAVNPNDSDNMIGSANDYQLKLSNGGTLNVTAFSRAHVTFDGGQTWTTYPIPYGSYTATGDPAVAFDADGTAYISTLGFAWSQGLGSTTNPDVLVSTSTNGGKTWTNATRVASGTGSFYSVGVFNDKEYLTAWGHGNAIVTWTVFNDGVGGSYINSPIYDSVTHDGGETWSTPTEISGSASFCIGAQGGTACDQDQGATPVVAADGSIYVSFLSTRETTNYSDFYLVVKIDPATGEKVAGPYKVADVVDGINDYPVSIDGLQTYQDSQFRTWSLGNIAADPTDSNHLVVAWSDMRNTDHPVNPDPYSAVTNSDIIVSQSFDGGETWSAPMAIKQKLAGDQFMPWAVYDSSGKLNIGFFDRAYDKANHEYGYTLATETTAGKLKFHLTQVTNTLSNPTKGDRWFAVTINGEFPYATTFLGDYSGIAAGSSGVVNLWTDMRESTTFGTRTGQGENAFFGMTP